MDECENPAAEYYSSSVDTSRPFRSVKEAVAIFGERLILGDMCTPKPYVSPKKGTSSSWTSPSPTPNKEDEQLALVASTFPSSWNSSPSSNRPRKEDDHRQLEIVSTLKKLESELEETKTELKMLKERESETEVALASLNAQLHMNMSKLAEAEAAAAGARAVVVRPTSAAAVDQDRQRLKEEERKREMMIRMENSPTLAEILSLAEKQAYMGGKRQRKTTRMMKKKPIIPLVSDLFWWKKGAPNSSHEPLYSSPQVNLY